MSTVKPRWEDSPLVLGLFPASSEWFWGKPNSREAARTLREAVDAGVAAVDTAPCYGWTSSERLVGDVVGSREDIVVLTKCGLVWEEPRGQVFMTVRDSTGKKRLYRDLRPKSVRRECEKSLKLLRRERIDVLQCHWPDPETPIEDTLGELLRLRDEGKIGGIGLCNYSRDEVLAAVRVAPIDLIQGRYNLLQQGTKKFITPAQAAELSVPFLAYAPLAHGALAEPRMSRTEGGERWQTRWLKDDGQEQIARLRRRLKPLTERYQCSFVQLALSFAANAAGVTGIIVGVTNSRHLADDVKAMGTTIRDRDMAEIRQVVEGELKRNLPARSASAHRQEEARVKGASDVQPAALGS